MQHFFTMARALSPEECVMIMSGYEQFKETKSNTTTANEAREGIGSTLLTEYIWSV